jgi:hypothetical protein
MLLLALLAPLVPYILPVTFALTALRAMPDATRLHVIGAAAAGGAIGMVLSVWLAMGGFGLSVLGLPTGALQGAAIGIGVLLVRGNMGWFTGRP